MDEVNFTTSDVLEFNRDFKRSFVEGYFHANKCYAFRKKIGPFSVFVGNV